jgi:hypothetical protein
LLPNLVSAPLGADGSAGFGWKDINVYKLGVQWKANEVWMWGAEPRTEVLNIPVIPHELAKSASSTQRRSFDTATIPREPRRAMAAPKLLDRMRARLRTRHYSIRTEET